MLLLQLLSPSNTPTVVRLRSCHSPSGHVVSRAGFCPVRLQAALRLLWGEGKGDDCRIDSGDIC